MVVQSSPNTHGDRGLRRRRDVYRRTDKERKKILKNPTGSHANLKIYKVDCKKKITTYPYRSSINTYLFLCAVSFFLLLSNLYENEKSLLKIKSVFFFIFFVWYAFMTLQYVFRIGKKSLLIINNHNMRIPVTSEKNIVSLCRYIIPCRPCIIFLYSSCYKRILSDSILP